MKKAFFLLVSIVIGLAVFAAGAQPAGPPKPNLDGATEKLFGKNTTFSAIMEFHTTTTSGGEMVMPGKIAHLANKSRFDMDMSQMQGANIPPQAVARMKQMGMSRMASITLNEKKRACVIYPDLKAYVENATPQQASTASSDYKSEVTKLGEETVDGHDCAKNEVVVTGPDGEKHESTVWNASDLKDFPIKIQMNTQRGTVAMLFKDVKLEKPDRSLFEVPNGFTKYDSMMSLMMKRAQGAPPQ